MARRRLAPTSLLALLTLGLIALAPSAGIRVHRHADHGSAHVHLEDLLGGRAWRELEVPSVSTAAPLREREDLAGAEGRARPEAPPFSYGDGQPAGASVGRSPLARSPSLAGLPEASLEPLAIGEASSLASRSRLPGFHLSPNAAHAHASSPFLRTIPAALACWIVALFVLSAATDLPASWTGTRAGRARARSPPLASRSLRAI
jgi:hypothetical protein